eukprot:MONOS_3030.1-p1 / transcript=MONOS_3030.1 / gene=MONOS_3030 / organism=Monocercomonoides_exilis_PA203 / gene_product=NOL1 / transcript_product=NOL1 / location=Mono_scaffold00067:70604-72769(-) / protein_length=721 / sequence_SO=supercontig / SO=protein_coding / is_pseudo=false
MLMGQDNRVKSCIIRHAHDYGEHAELLFKEPNKSFVTSEFQKFKEKKNATTNEELLPSNLQQSYATETEIPVYFRVNSMKTTLNNTVNKLIRTKKFKHIQSDIKKPTKKLDEKEQDSKCHHKNDLFHEILRQPSSNFPCSFMIDPQVYGLLVVPRWVLGTSTCLGHSGKLLEEMDVIVQDKASCVPAVILNPPPGSIVVDCCAAPGNKTIQLAEMVSGARKRDEDEWESASSSKSSKSSLSSASSSAASSGHVLAFERDHRRAVLLQKRISQSGCDELVDVLCEDFLDIDIAKAADYLKLKEAEEKKGRKSRWTENDASASGGDSESVDMMPLLLKATHVLLDPSCSGSGMKRSIETMLGSGVNENEEEEAEDSDAEEEMKKVKRGKSSRRGKKKGQEEEEEEEEEESVDKLNKKRKSQKAEDEEIQTTKEKSECSLVQSAAIPSEFSSSSKKVKELSELQFSLLCHAARLPCVTSMTYSTCSQFVEEDEEVVARFLKAEREKEKETADSPHPYSGFHLTSPKNFNRPKTYSPLQLSSQLSSSSSTSSSTSPSTSHDGASAIPPWMLHGFVVDGLSKEEAEMLVRFVCPADHTNGFFVALFERNVAGLETTTQPVGSTASDAEILVKEEVTLDKALLDKQCSAKGSQKELMKRDLEETDDSDTKKEEEYIPFDSDTRQMLIPLKHIQSREARSKEAPAKGAKAGNKTKSSHVPFGGKSKRF